MKNLSDYLRGAQASLFRFEYLQDFSATDKEDMAKWEHNELDADEIGKGWWEELDILHKKGVITQRVRRVVYPVNKYTEFELAIHKAAVKHGDDIRVIDDDAFEGLHVSFQDFWLIDDAIAIVMKYGDQGLYEGFSIDEAVGQYVNAKALLLERSQPLA